MNQKIPALVAMLCATSITAQAAGQATVGGFADITYTNDNNLSLFKANAEIDITHKASDELTVRLDTDLALAGNTGVNAGVDGPADSAIIEQAYFALSMVPKVTVLGGVFNNPIGWEAEDAPDMYQITSGQIKGILDGQTALYGNNVAGVAAAVDAGLLTLTAGVLNEIGHSDLEKNSYALLANMSPMQALDIEIGYVTQEAQAENVTDVNLTYSMNMLTVGAEYLMAEKVVDTAMGLMVNVKPMKAVGITVRYDVVSYEDSAIDDSTSMALAASYAVTKNLDVLAEYSSLDNGTTTDEVGMLEFIAAF